MSTRTDGHVWTELCETSVVVMFRRVPRISSHFVVVVGMWMHASSLRWKIA